MDLVFQGSHPDAKALYFWAYNNVTVEKELVEGYIYNLPPGGYLSQFENCGYTATEVGIHFRYNNTNDYDIPVELILNSNEPDDAIRIVVSLAPTIGYQTLTFTIPIKTLYITTAAIEIRLKSDDKKIIFSMIEITAEVTKKETTSSYNDFNKYCILYGLDVDKPNLEVIGNDDSSNIS